VVFQRRLIYSLAQRINKTTSHLCYTKKILLQYIIAVKVSGSFRLAARISHLHEKFNFTEFMLETVGQSLRHSCRTPIKCQGISLP